MSKKRMGTEHISTVFSVKIKFRKIIQHKYREAIIGQGKEC